MYLKTLRTILCAGIVGTALIAPSAASAATVPNAGFEANCGGVPCNWTPGGGTTTWDTTNPHSGSASLRLNIANSVSPNQASASSDCTNATIPTGIRAVSYWYRANTGVSGLAMTVNLFANPGCVTGIKQVGISPNPVDTSGTWRQVSAGINVTQAAASFKITLAVGCASGCSNARAANFDDLTLDSTPTAATLLSFRGSHTAKGVRVTWKTAAMPQLAGFNLYRGSTRLNRTLVRAFGSRTFSWVDRSAPGARTLTYRLQAVYLDGTRAWLGTTRV